MQPLMMESEEVLAGAGEEFISEALQEFYCSPFLTCSECNSISFIDAVQLRKALVSETTHGSNLKLEALPRCPTCR